MPQQFKDAAKQAFSAIDFLPGTIWSTPANTRQGPHEALGDVELLTVRLGPMGLFERDAGPDAR